VYRRDTTTASYEQVVLSTHPNTILYFGVDSSLNEFSASTIYITSSHAVYSLSASYAPGNPSISASYANNSTTSSYALSSSYPWFDTGSNIAYVGGNVGIGTTLPTNTLDINGTTRLRNSMQLDGGSVWTWTAGYGSILKCTSAGAGMLGFGTANRNSDLIIDNTGSVGIGTITPTSKLHISGSTANETLLNIQNNTGTNSLSISSSGLISFGNGPFTIAGGQVAAYTATINGSLYVSSTTYLGTALYASNIYEQGASTNAGIILSNYLTRSLSFTTSGSERVRINSAGNVGIGTTNPVNKLDVVGNISCSVITASLFTSNILFPYTTLTTSSTNWITCNFADNEQYVNITNGLLYNFTCSNPPPAGQVLNTSLYLNNTATATSSLAFPATWAWIGNIPTYMSSSKSAILNLKAYGSSIVGAWGSQF
jgi:hypothetical protein